MTEYVVIGGVLLVGVVIWCVMRNSQSAPAPPPYATNTIGGGMCEKAVAAGGTIYASSKGVPPQAGASISAMGAPVLCNIMDKVGDALKTGATEVAKGVGFVANKVQDGASAVWDAGSDVVGSIASGLDFCKKPAEQWCHNTEVMLRYGGNKKACLDFYNRKRSEKGCGATAVPTVTIKPALKPMAGGVLKFK